MEYQLGMWCRFFFKLFSVYGRYRSTVCFAPRFDWLQLRCVYNSKNSRLDGITMVFIGDIWYIYWCVI